jgi:hypothetical protein
MNAVTQDLFERYRENAQGHLVPIETIDPLDLEKDELVKDIIAKALVLQASIREFKAATQGDMLAFLELVGEKYGVKMSGPKGNLCLRTFDGRFKAEINTQDYLVFDERIHVAKQSVDKCIHRWTDGSRAEVRALIEHAFQVDSQGKFSLGRILGLTKLAIDDEEWRQAMRAVRDALQIVDSKSYIRLYERREDGKFVPIPLDIAAL